MTNLDVIGLENLSQEEMIEMNGGVVITLTAAAAWWGACALAGVGAGVSIGVANG